jgi:TonB-linked SusC/RagA family outer membrane protein
VINAAMRETATTLDAVVVTAMGITREKKALGYAVQEVKSDQLSQAASTNIGSALQGKISGMEIIPSSGMPGASTKITIRGSRSFTGDNTPLYVVDGLPISSSYDISTLNSVTASDFSTRALDLDPNDIESINILKGQAASALYGMRASNGVVLITTVKGKAAARNKVSVSFNSNITFDVISAIPDFQTEFAQGSGGRYNPTASTSWGPLISELPNDPTYGGNTDNAYTASGKKQGYYWVRQRSLAGLDPWALPQVYDNAREFFNTGTTWSNSLNVTKAFDGGVYALSLGNTNQNGIVPSTGMDRYNAKFSTDLQLAKHWDAGFTGNFVHTSLTKSTGANDGIIATVYGAPASYDFAGIPSHIKGDPYTQNTFRGTTGFDGAYWAVKNNKFAEKTQRFFGNTYIKYNTSFSDKDKLDVKYQLGIDSYSTDYTDLFGYGHANQTGELDRYIVTKNELNSLFTAIYTRKFGEDLTMDLMYGNEIIEYQRRTLDVYGTGFNFSGWNHLNNLSNYSGSESVRNKRTIGNFGNLSLSYKNMLFLNASLRNDILSSMPPENRSFTYPSVSLGWIFTELDPLKNEVLTFGKLRFSYAQVGQAGDYTDSYYSTPTYSGGFSSGTPIMYPINGITAYTLYGVVYDPNLKPQNTLSYEIGTDLSFFNGLASLNYTYSRQNVKDQIFRVPLAGSTGTSDLLTNGGSIHTDTHEFTLEFAPFREGNIKWNFAFNFTKVNNYVDKLAPGVESIFLGGFVEPQIRASIGHKFPTIYGSQFMRNADGKIVVDANGLPQVGEETELGTVEPDFRLGFTTNFEIYKLRISAVLDWKQGGYIYSATAGLLDYYGRSQRSADFRKKDNFLFEYEAVKETGTDAQGNPTYAPNDILIAGSDAQTYFSAMNNVTESMIKENSFIKLREIALSYPVWENKNFSIMLNAFARNIILWSSIKGFDPESSQGNTNMSGGFERFSLPGTSSYGFGIGIKF